jgi:hypothetical protein
LLPARILKMDAGFRFMMTYPILGKAYNLGGVVHKAKPEDYKLGKSLTNLLVFYFDMRPGSPERIMDRLADMKGVRISGIKLVYCTLDSEK